MGTQLVIMCSASALAGLCANPAHQAGEHPNGGSTAVIDRAFTLGKALAAKLEAELDGEGDERHGLTAERDALSVEFDARGKRIAELEEARCELEAERDALRAKLAAPPPVESETKIDDAAPTAESKKKR
jgi:hypothetical protein